MGLPGPRRPGEDAFCNDLLPCLPSSCCRWDSWSSKANGGMLSGEASWRHLLHPARGELPVECGGSGYGVWNESGYGLEYGSGYGLEFGSGYGYGSGLSSVSISVVVRSATTNEEVAGALVEFTLGDFIMTNTTDEQGLAIFTFSFDDIVVPEEGIAATVEISMENFVSYSYTRMIEHQNMVEELLSWQEVAIAISP